MFVPLLKIHVFLGNDYAIITYCMIFCQPNMQQHTQNHSACCISTEGLIFIFLRNVYYFILRNIYL